MLLSWCSWLRQAYMQQAFPARRLAISTLAVRFWGTLMQGSCLGASPTWQNYNLLTLGRVTTSSVSGFVFVGCVLTCSMFAAIAYWLRWAYWRMCQGLPESFTRCWNTCTKSWTSSASASHTYVKFSCKQAVICYRLGGHEWWKRIRYAITWEYMQPLPGHKFCAYYVLLSLAINVLFLMCLS